jgi:hypothetical protein
MNEQMKAVNTRIFAEIREEGYEVLHGIDASTENAGALNRELLLRIIRKNSGTEYGRKYGFSEIRDVDAYRRQVPFTVYSDYEPYIERMTQKGEQNVLTAEPPVYYAETSGTTGKPKNVPVTADGLRTFLDFTTAPMPAVISEFYRNTRQTDIEYGKEFAALSLVRNVFPSGTPYGSLSATFTEDGDGDEEEDGDIDFFGCYETTPEAVMRCGGKADMKYLHTRYAVAEPDVVYLTSAYIPALVDLMDYIRDHHEMLVRDIREGVIDPAPDTRGPEEDPRGRAGAGPRTRGRAGKGIREGIRQDDHEADLAGAGGRLRDLGRELSALRAETAAVFRAEHPVLHHVVSGVGRCVRHGAASL